MHRAKIAQLRVRMEGWRQRRPGSNARNPQEGKSKQKEQTEKSKQKEKNTLDSYRPSHGRSQALILEGVQAAKWGVDQGKWDSAAEWVVSSGLPAVVRLGSSRTQ